MLLSEIYWLVDDWIRQKGYRGVATPAVTVFSVITNAFRGFSRCQAGAISWLRPCYLRVVMDSPLSIYLFYTIEIARRLLGQLDKQNHSQRSHSLSHWRFVLFYLICSLFYAIRSTLYYSQHSTGFPTAKVQTGSKYYPNVIEVTIISRRIQIASKCFFFI